MSTQIRCPQGHLWALDEFESADPIDPAVLVACPYCGTLGTVVTDLSSPLTVRESPDERETLQPPRTEFPGYQVVDRIGRGGMGVVYRARQIHTDRLVAIKVPEATDLEAACRFGTEAKAAARVQSANIVQVFEVGQQAGRSYLIMEYCPGGSLADRLDGTPLPVEPVASLLEALARAVGAAHTAGVVHRDLKPGNILLCPKAATDVAAPFDLDQWVAKITDFGLARRMDVDLRQTQSGAILGTPGYMAPEQAAGENQAIGPAVDVYALGIILYELLTGRRPFSGTNLLETLEQIRTTEPVAPTRLRPQIPSDLETICLKCLHKDPVRRYASGAALADDLARFRGGHPIVARPVSSVERLIKRARRNPALTAMMVGVALIVVGAAAYGIWYQFRLEAQRDRARYHFEISLKSIEEMLAEVAPDDLAHEPGAEQKRKALLEKALHFYGELQRVESDDPELAWLAARATRRVGDIQRQLGRHDEARESYGRALGRLEPLAANPATRDKARREQADCHNYLGEIERDRGEPALAADSYRRALEIQNELHAADPEHADYRQDLARTRYNLGIIARHTERIADALAELNEAARLLNSLPVQDREIRHHLARVYVNLGPVYRAAKQLPQADNACAEAVRLFEGLVDEFPDRVVYRFELARTLINHGHVKLDERDLAPASHLAGQAKEQLEDLADKYPRTPAYQTELARACNSLAAVEFERGDRDAVIRNLEQAVQVLRGLSENHTDSPSHHGELGIALGNLGRAVYSTRPAEARRHFAHGILEIGTALKANPADSNFLASIRQQSQYLAVLHVAGREHDAAREQASQLTVFAPNQSWATRLAVCFLADCIDAINRSDSASTSADEIDRYAKHAAALVRKLPTGDRVNLLKDGDCNSLRGHADFVAAVGGKD